MNSEDASQVAKITVRDLLQISTTPIINLLNTYVESPVALYLTWIEDPTTTMVVRWITHEEDEQEEDALFFRKKDSHEPWQYVTGSHTVFPEKLPYITHTVSLSQLTENSLYEFQLQRNRNKTYLFQTMPKKLTRSITFVEGGDTYPESTEFFEQTCICAAQHEPLFTLFGGDLAYASYKNRPSHEDRWIAWITAYSSCMITPSGRLIPIITAIGNHDVQGAQGQTRDKAACFYHLFPTPQDTSYHTLHFGTYLALYFLDTNHTAPIDGAQAYWLKIALAKDYAYTHKIASYHIPAYPSKRSFRTKESSMVRRHWVPIFDHFGLHIAFEHHDHTYKRTIPLIGDSFHRCGVVYIGDGAWGTPPRTPKNAAQTTYLEVTAKKTHFIKVKLSSTKREFWAISSTDGCVFDHFVQDISPIYPKYFEPLH